MSERVIGRPFQPGQSGNPNGRPKSRPFREALDRAIKAAGDDPDAGLSLDDIAKALLIKAKSGDVPAIKELAERYDGKVAQAVIGGDEVDPAVSVIHTIRRIIVDPRHSDSESVSPASDASQV